MRILIALIFILTTFSVITAGNIYTFGPSLGTMEKDREYHPVWTFDFTAVWADLRGYESTSLPALSWPKMPVLWTSVGFKQVISSKDNFPVICYGEMGGYYFINAGIGYSYPLEKYDNGKGAHLFLGIPFPLPFFDSELFIEPYGRVMLKRKGEREYGVMIKYFLD
ncbi:MAG: hypothetical protein JXK07_16075 [Spirochaetes bacterium]|nr:hypothetical protein [Spirochaetota bacterium]MBN2772001.1 hypothetical protein [Spirochaetota bacterium]